MKHDKKPGNDRKRITMLAAGTAASVAVLAGGVRIWNSYQNGSLFRPDLFVSNHDYQENQIMFPEKNDYGQNSQADTSDDNHRLERDPQADDSYGKDKKDDPEYQMTGDGSIETDLKNASNIVINPGTAEMPDGSLPQELENSASVIAGTSSIPSQSVVQFPIGNGSNGSSGIAASHLDDSDHDRDSDSGSSNRNQGGNSVSGGNTSGGGSGDINNGETPPVPTPDPVPDPTPVPDPVPTPTPDPAPVVDPDYPNEGDRPSQPENPPGLDFPAFPSSGISPDSSSHVSLTFADLYYYENPGEILYNGAVLTDLKLLCSMYVFVDIKDANDKFISRYRIAEYSDNFRVGEFPSVVDGNFTVKFYFRPNADSDWQEYEKTFEVKYAKYVVLDDDGSTLSEGFVEHSGDRISLLKPTQKYYEKHTDEFGDPDNLDFLFPGWSLTPGGTLLGNWFTPTEPGRYVFYPAERVPVPDGMTVSASAGWDPTDLYCYAGYLQRLVSAPGDVDVLDIPEGIQEVGGDDFLSIFSIHDIGTLVLPNTALLLYPKYYIVRDA